MMMVPKFREYSKVGDILKYTAITNNCIVNMEEKSLTSVFELVISYLDLEEVMQSRHDRLNKLLCDMPAEGGVSIYLTKIMRMPDLPGSAHTSAIVGYLDRKRKDQINGTPSPQYRCYLAITFRTEHSKKADARQQGEEFRRLKVRLDNFIRGVQAGMHGSMLQLDSSQITTFLGHLLNHEDAAVGQKISDIFTSDFNASNNGKKPFGYVYYGGKYHAVMGFRAYGEQSRIADNTYASMNNIWHHRDLQNIEFTIQQQMCYQGKEKALAIANRRKNLISGRKLVARNFNLKFLEKTPEGLNVEELYENVSEAIELVETSGERFIEWQYRVHIWDEILEGLEHKIDEMMAVVGTTHRMTPEKWNVKAAYFSLFPGSERIDTMKVTLPSYNVADYMPIDLPRTCHDDGSSGKYLYYYAESNELTRYDLFDRRASAWNGIVCGGTGSGKSFLLNDIIAQFMEEYKGQVAICDYGGVGAGSYRNLVINSGGTYLEINFDSDEFSINPFEGKLYGDNGEVTTKFTSLLATLERMILSNSTESKLDGEARYELQKLLRRYYKDTNDNASNECNLNEFADNYLKPRLERIYKLLFPFIGVGEHAGPYARFFRKTRHVANKDVVCFDMAGLKGHEQLKNVLVPALLDMICNDVLGADPARKKMLVMDEAWQDLSRGGAMQDFIEEMYRTVRKLGGTCYVITQRFEDVLQAQIGGALIANTHYFYFVGNTHKPEAICHAEAASSTGAMALSEYDVNTITESMPKRDFYLLCPFFAGKLKFFPTKEFCVLATTDPTEKGIIAQHMAKLDTSYVTPEVIESVKGCL